MNNIIRLAIFFAIIYFVAHYYSIGLTEDDVQKSDKSKIANRLKELSYILKNDFIDFIIFMIITTFIYTFLVDSNLIRAFTFTIGDIYCIPCTPSSD